jgi:hypothetical protein
MSGILGGSSASTDRSNQLAGINGSWNVFNAGMPLSQQQSQSGQAGQATATQGLGQASDFWKSILSGNSTSIAAATAPLTNAAVNQADAAKRQEASMGTARGGGTNEGNQQIESNTRATVNNDVFSALPAAAQGEQSVATAQGSLGSSQLMQSLQALGLSAEEANQITNSSIASRSTSIQANPLNAASSILMSKILSSLGFGSGGSGGSGGGSPTTGFAAGNPGDGTVYGPPLPSDGTTPNVTSTYSFGPPVDTGSPTPLNN